MLSRWIVTVCLGLLLPLAPARAQEDSSEGQDMVQRRTEIFNPQICLLVMFSGCV
jgi:hypothetical protein